MARAQAKKWLRLGAGLLVGLAGPIVSATAQSDSLDEHRPVARVRGASEARMALNQAIEKHRRGSYEAVEPLVRIALEGQAYLTDTEQNELARLVKDNRQALQARRDGLMQLQQAEADVKAGAMEQAQQRLRILAGTEQFLPSADRQRLATLWRQAHGIRHTTARGLEPTGPELDPTPESDEADNPVKEAYRKVQEARSALARYNFDEAERLAREADRMGVTFARPEDSPKAILQAIDHSRSDAKIMLSASRAALRQQQYDKAEQLAKQAEELGTWTFTIWGDKPSKVLADIQQARAQGTTGSPTPMTSSGDARTDALDMLKKGRQALSSGDVASARALAEQAQTLKANLKWYDDNPTKLLAAVQAAEMKAPKPSQSTATPTRSAKRMTKDEAEALLAKGKRHLAAGELEEAHQIALELKAAHWLEWGTLFGDTPDSFKLAVQKARTARDKEASVKVLEQGRKLLAENKLEEATQAAYRAQKLHGPYSKFRDLGDRPEALLEDIAKAKVKLRTSGDQGSTRQVSTEASELEKARKWLAVARQYIRRGDLDKAKQIADYVEASKIVMGPDDDTPAKIRADLDRISRVEGAMNSVAVKPTPTPKAEEKPQEEEKDDVELARAKKLLVEARKLQEKGHLLGAHRKAVEAQKLGVKFPVGEDSPEDVLQQLMGMARKYIEGHTRVAVDVVEHGKGDKAKRIAEADKRLTYAHHLAKEYGQDMTLVAAKMEWLEKIKNDKPISSQPVALPSQPVALPSKPLPTLPNDNQGREFLAQARRELRAGNLRGARKLAEDAMKGEFGVEQEALAVIRSVDSEQINQKSLQACRTFDSAMGAYRRKDYAFASSMMNMLDANLLDPERRAQLREVVMTPEMAQASRSTPGGTTVQRTGTQSTDPTGTFPEGGTPPGMASASDQQPRPKPSNPGDELIDTIKARRHVTFQAYQTKGLEKMKLASEKFRTGQTDEALSLLEEHLAKIDAETDLEPNMQALLKRSVSARLSQFKLLKAQQDWLVKSERDRKTRATSRGQRFLAQQSKQEQVAKLMREFNTFYRDGKFAEARRAATQAQELDPDNAVVSAAKTMAVRRMRLSKDEERIENNDELATHALLDAGDLGAGSAEAAMNGLHYDDVRWSEMRERRGGATQQLGTPTGKEAEIERLLNAPVTLNFTNEPMYAALDYIRAWHGINIDIDDAALNEMGVDLSRPITIKVDNISLRSALNLLLDKVRLTWVVRDEVLQVTTKDRARGKLQTATHQVADLVIPVNDFGSLDPSQTQNNSPLHRNRPIPYNGTTGPSPVNDQYAIAPGNPVGSPGGTTSPFGTGASNGGGVDVTMQRARTKEDVLIKLITNTIAPESWRDMGGAGQIDYFPLTMSLVINQTPDIQEQIADLLQALRRLQDQEVAVEVRFVLVAEEFYERIGVNFQMNILQDNDRWEPQLTSGVFAPNGYINAFEPRNFLTGITPAGTFTQDLNIPINNSTFFQSIPPFGGYQAGVGGITTGLAFLSDIQVFMFLEAVQSDRRTNVMQAPRLTMFNGQTATLQVSDDTFFVTGVGIQQVPGTGQFVFVPQITPLPIQSTILSLQSVISADRRFVRLSMNQNFFSQVPGPVVSAFPITVPIFTPAGGTGFVTASDPVVFTQFIQQPRISTISVGTTVMVPDGGTVLLGGLKRLSEGRTELGPPVLSKIKWVNRLFKNVGYGRESASLLIMVTPRIIIQEEEEFRQTGFRSNPLLGTGADVIPELGP